MQSLFVPVSMLCSAVMRDLFRGFIPVSNLAFHANTGATCNGKF